METGGGELMDPRSTHTTTAKASSSSAAKDRGLFPRSCGFLAKIQSWSQEETKKTQCIQSKGWPSSFRPNGRRLKFPKPINLRERERERERERKRERERERERERSCSSFKKGLHTSLSHWASRLIQAQWSAATERPHSIPFHPQYTRV